MDSFRSELGVGATEEVVPEVKILNEVSDENKCFERKHVDAEVQTPNCPAYSIHNFEKDEAAVHFYTGLETYMKFFFILHTSGPAAFCLKYM